MSDFLLCFVPLFVAMDPPGILPIYIGLTGDLTRSQRHRVILQSVFTAAVVGMLFIAVGRVILTYVGITIADFMIAGGLLLFVLALSDLLNSDKPQRRVAAEHLGAVPLGVPLMVGPAVLTTGLLLVDEHGYALTSGALGLNIFFTGILLWSAGWVMRVLGEAGAQILSKLVSLLMAAIAVMLVRKGIGLILASG